jgi:hypothetical protein
MVILGDVVDVVGIFSWTDCQIGKIDDVGHPWEPASWSTASTSHRHSERLEQRMLSKLSDCIKGYSFYRNIHFFSYLIVFHA